MLVGGTNSVCKEICDALGLKHVLKLDFHMEVNSIVTVEAKVYPEVDGVRQLIPILKKCKLVTLSEEEIPISQKDDLVNTTELGDEFESHERFEVNQC